MEQKKQFGEPKADKPIFNPCAGTEPPAAQPEVRDTMPDFGHENEDSRS
ncbi:MAG TPA: hypothetical protein VHP54_01450 [Caproiciproducens sp.]|nr:hypothetical protein [Caproiciproducens sp.]